MGREEGKKGGRRHVGLSHISSIWKENRETQLNRRESEKRDNRREIFQEEKEECECVNLMCVSVSCVCVCIGLLATKGNNKPKPGKKR